MVDSTVAPKSLATVPAWVPNLIAGLVIGFMQVIIGISLVSLIFSGPLAHDLPTGIAMVLVTSAVNGIFIALFSSSPGIIAMLQDDPIVPIAVAATVFARTQPSGPELTATVIALIVTSTLLLGIFLVLLWRFRLCALVRYIPYPVFVGF